MRSLCAILGLLTVLVLMPTACSSNDQLDKPTPPDRHDMVEQQMQYVQEGATYVDVLSLVGRPDAVRRYTTPSGQRVLMAKWVGVHDWFLIFSNAVNDYGMVTGKVGSSLNLYRIDERR